MKIAQSDTAIASYHSLSVAGYLCPSEAKVMALFTSPDVLLTRKQIRDRCGMELSSVCGRVKSLLDKGALAKRAEITADTNKANELLGLPVPEQMELAV